MSGAKYKRWIAPEGLAKLEELAATKTDEELAREMGIVPSTYYKWQKDHPEIGTAIEKGRTGALAEKAVEAVEESLFDRCLGGVREVKKAMKIKTVEYDETTGRRLRETERIELAVEETYVPADTNAIKFYLTNRAPAKWKNKTELSADPETTESVEDFLRRIAEGGREF